MLKTLVSRMRGFVLRNIHPINDLAEDKDMKLNWKRLVGFAQEDLLGLDIGSSSVRMVQLARDRGGFSIVSAGLTEIEHSDDPDVKRANAVKAVKKCLTSASAHAKWAVCSVSGTEVAVRHFKFPPMRPEELEGAIRLEASQVCPFNVDDGVVEYQLIQNGAADDSVTGVLVAATNEVVKQKVQIVEKADLSCVLMDVDGLALLNCLSECKKDGEQISSVAILEVGSSSTTLAVLSENNSPFVRIVPYAGKDVVALIARENNVSPEVVMKDIYGTFQLTIPAENLQKSMESGCQKLVSDIAETLRYHSTQEKSTPVDRILVCGGFGMVRGFVDILNRQLPVKAILWNPFDTMKCSVGRQMLDVIQTKGPVMAVAAGLAMRSV